METTSYEDGYNVVVIRCDGCGREIAQPRQADGDWFRVRVTRLARDAWAEEDPLAELDFCSPGCLQETLGGLDPAEGKPNRG